VKPFNPEEEIAEKRTEETVSPKRRRRKNTLSPDSKSP
jgi:hypothetical protein